MTLRPGMTAHGAGDVVGQPDDAAGLDAGGRFELVEGDDGALRQADDAALHAIVVEHGLQQAGILFEGCFVELGGAAFRRGLQRRGGREIRAVAEIEAALGIRGFLRGLRARGGAGDAALRGLGLRFRKRVLARGAVDRARGGFVDVGVVAGIVPGEGAVCRAARGDAAEEGCELRAAGFEGEGEQGEGAQRNEGGDAERADGGIEALGPGEAGDDVGGCEAGDAAGAGIEAADGGRPGEAERDGAGERGGERQQGAAAQAAGRVAGGDAGARHEEEGDEEGGGEAEALEEEIGEPGAGGAEEVGGLAV